MTGRNGSECVTFSHVTLVRGTDQCFSYKFISPLMYWLCSQLDPRGMRMHGCYPCIKEGPSLISDSSVIALKTCAFVFD
jgi:hypothetical protein